MILLDSRRLTKLMFESVRGPECEAHPKPMASPILVRYSVEYLLELWSRSSVGVKCGPLGGIIIRTLHSKGYDIRKL